MSQLRATSDAVEDERRQGKISRQLAGVRDLYELGDLQRDDYLAKKRALQLQLAKIPTRHQIDFGKALELLKDFGRLWANAGGEMRKRFVDELFESKRITGKRLHLRLKPVYGRLVTLKRARGDSNPRSPA